MTDREIKSFTNKHEPKSWYYYYDFGSVKVRPELKTRSDEGMNNWRKISSVLKPIFENFNPPRVLDIGCNMGLYDYQMERIGAEVTGLDKDIEKATFFQRYVHENLHKDFRTRFVQTDITRNGLLNGHYDVVTMFCVIYHLEPCAEKVLKTLPGHDVVVLQGNLKRVSSKKRGMQKLAGPKGMVRLLERNGYFTKVHKFGRYNKPIVVGQR